MPVRTFRGTIDADWNTAANWLELAVPTVADDVLFDAASPACTLSAAGNCLTLDCTGFAATITPGANTVTVAGLLFRLVAGCWVVGTAIVDFTAVAGVCLITTAGNTLYTVRTGNGGAGGTWQLQDALAVDNDLLLVRSTFQTNNQNITITRDLIASATFTAGGFAAGSSTVTIGRTISWNSQMMNAASCGTSKVILSGTGSIISVGDVTCYFYDLQCAAATKVTTVTTGGSDNIIVQGTLTFGTGSIASTVGRGFKIYYTTNAAPLVVGAPTVTCAAAIAFTCNSNGNKTLNLPVWVHNASLNFGANGDLNGTRDINLTGNLVVTGAFSMGELSSTSTVYRRFNLNGFNLTINGNLTFQSQGYNMVVGAKTLTVTGNVTLSFSNGTDRVCFNIAAGGVAAIGGNMNGGALTTCPQILIATGGLMTIGGNWATSTIVLPMFSPASGGTVQFTAPGVFTIANTYYELWPSVVISGGGSVTLPNGFNCYNLNITAGLVTAGNPFTVRNAMTNGGTFTGSPNMNIGSSFINTGILVLAGTNIVAVNPVVSLSGFNPVTLTMGPDCLRLQLLTSMNITTFILADRVMPGVVQFLATGTYNIGTMNSQIASTDGMVQFISSVAGTRYTWNVTAAITSLVNVWPRDNDASASAVAPVGGLTNKDLGNNVNWTLYFPSFIRVISDDPGQDLLAFAGFGKLQYCWLVATSPAALAVLATAFGAGANNWHRKTNIPFAMLDNLNKGDTYYVALGIVDERNRRIAPNVGAGDLSTAIIATSGESGGGGSHVVTVSTAFAVPG